MATPSGASYRPPSPLELERKSRPARRAALGQSGVAPKGRAPDVTIPKPPPVPARIAAKPKLVPRPSATKPQPVPIAAIPLRRARKPRLALAPPPPPPDAVKPAVVVLGCIWLLG